MRCFGHTSQSLACLLALVALIGMANPASAVPQRLTFVGPVTSSEFCFEILCRPETPLGTIVSYTFVVDFDRLGETIVRNASGETVTTFPGTFFADFLGTPPTLGGPPESEVRTITHIGRGLTLTDEERVVSSENNGFPDLSVSLAITGRPGADWTIGSQFAGGLGKTHLPERQFFISSSTHSALTLIVPEPGMLVLISASLVVLVCLPFRSLRLRRRLRQVGLLPPA